MGSRIDAEGWVLGGDTPRGIDYERPLLGVNDRLPLALRSAENGSLPIQSWSLRDGFV